MALTCKYPTGLTRTFCKVYDFLLNLSVFGRVSQRKTLQIINEDNSLSIFIDTVCFVQLKL